MGVFLKLFRDEDVQEIMELAFRVSDENSDGELTFCEFCVLVYRLSERCGHDEKCKFMYKMFSQDDTPLKDSIVGNKEITKESLTAIVKSTLKTKGVTDQGLIDRSVDDAITKLSKERPGVITFEEFQKEAERNPHSLQWLRIDVERVLAIVVDDGD